MPAQACDRLPPPGALPGGLVFQLKFDGYRALLFTPSPALGSTILQSRRGAFIQGRFADLGQAAGDLPDGPLLDGELVVWDGEQLSSRRCSAVPLPVAGQPYGSYAWSHFSSVVEPKEVLTDSEGAVPAAG
ncbi:hypothetical protein [Streptomyces sp. Ru72]|uniref:hypothetical protein n=1 Tax=Streptomyces sp. Ru72 TaxID=2080747 RepID=UPI000CDD8E4C|nr:hypothetical protein [Streptomyces sp. Ru72]POX44666.1 hypothetical protein C3488_32160 [Streptomyces sp. Ru72]